MRKRKGNKNGSLFDKHLLKRIKEDPAFAEAYFENLSELPLSAQFALLRRLYGITQEAIASKLRIRQGHVSKLERKGSNHHLSQYEKVAKVLRFRLAVLPEGARIVFGQRAA